MQHKIIDAHDVVIRFAGDSGDGMQLTGSLFADMSAIYGNGLSTFPDYPAEIRAPHGTVSTDAAIPADPDTVHGGRRAPSRAEERPSRFPVKTKG